MKNLIYLNDHKLYSLATQLFEGLAEALVGDSEAVAAGDGRRLAELFKAEQRGIDKRYVQDDAARIVEQHLLSIGKVLELDAEALSDSDADLPAQAAGYSFVRVSGRAVLIDAQNMIHNLRRFNQIGEAITFVTHYGELNRMQEEYQGLIEKVNQSSVTKHIKQNKLKELERAFQDSTDIKKLVKNSHLHADQTFIENVSLLLDYGYQDLFEIQIKTGPALFAAQLNPDYLREPASQMVRRYAKVTDRRFTLFGIITQNPHDKHDESARTDAKSIKEAVINLALQLSNVDTQFAGKLSNEITIEPIAVYSEI